MAIVIEDPTVVQKIEWLAAHLQVSPLQAIETAVWEKAARQSSMDTVDQATRERRLRAMAEAQEWFRLHGDKDPRTPDEIIGYDENGLFG